VSAFDPDADPPVTTLLRGLNYGPVVGEFHRDAMFGPQGNKLGPKDVAVSPDTGLQLGDLIKARGKDYTVADWSYHAPGRPTSRTIEFRDAPASGMIPVQFVSRGKQKSRVFNPDDPIPGETKQTKFDPSAPIETVDKSVGVRAAAPPTADSEIRRAEPLPQSEQPGGKSPVQATEREKATLEHPEGSPGYDAAIRDLQLRAPNMLETAVTSALPNLYKSPTPPLEPVEQANTPFEKVAQFIENRVGLTDDESEKIAQGFAHYVARPAAVLSGKDPDEVEKGLVQPLAVRIKSLTRPEMLVVYPFLSNPVGQMWIASQVLANSPDRVKEWATAKTDEQKTGVILDLGTDALMLVPITHTMLKKTVLKGGVTDAIKPSDAQIQARETPLREQTRPESEIPKTSDSDNVQRAVRGEETRTLPREAEAPTVADATRSAVDRHGELLSEGQQLGDQVRLLQKAGLPIPAVLQNRINTINEMLRQGYNPAIVENLATKDIHDEFAEIVAEERATNGNGIGKKRETSSQVRSASVAEPAGKTVTQEVGETLPLNLIGGQRSIREPRARAFGLNIIEKEARQTWGDAWDQAADRESTDPGVSERLAIDISERPRAVNTVEHAQLLRNMIAAEETHARAVDMVNDAGDDLSRERAQETLTSARDRLQTAYDAMAKSGTERGRSLNAMKMVADKYQNLARMEATRRAANGGQPLSPGQLAEVKTSHDSLKSIRERMGDVERGRGLDKQFARAVARSVMNMNEAPKGSKGIIEFLDSEADKARQRIIARRGRLNVGFDPTALTDEIIIGASHVARGLRDFGQWSAKMLDEFGERIRPYLKDIYDRAVAMRSAALERASDLKKLSAYKTRLRGQTETLRAKIDEGDLTRIIRRKLPLDKEAFALRQEYQAMKKRFDDMIERDRAKNRPGWQKLTDTFVAFERAIKLTGITTIGKIAAAAGTRIIQSITENAVGAILSKVPGLSRIAAQAPREGRLSLPAERAGLRGVGTGIREMPRVATGQISTYETRIPSSKILGAPGRIHGVLKRPAWRNEFERSKVMFTESAEKLGKDVSDPEVQQQIYDSSKANADRAIFLQDNIASSAWNSLIRSWESSKKFPIAGFVLSRIARFLLPIVRVPTNVALETGTMIGGTLTGTGKLIGVMGKGLENIKPEEADMILRHYKKGLIGAGLFLTGFLNPDNFGGFFVPKEKREGTMHWGDATIMGVRIPWWLLHAPPFLVMQAGATTAKLLPQRGAVGASLATTHALLDEIPFMRELNFIDSALGEGWGSTRAIGQLLQGTVVPQALNNVSQWTDQKDTNGNPIRRYPRTAIDYVKLGIPGLREQVPTTPARKTHRKQNLLATP